MATHEYKCTSNEKDLLILHTDYPDGLAIELYSDTDDIGLSDEDARDMAEKIIEFLDDKAERDEEEKEKTSYARMQEQKERAWEAKEDEEMERYFEMKYGDED